jgi:DNA-binding NtrC family response regulator
VTDAQRPVLVVIADPQRRQLVGWILDELELPNVLVATWRAAVAKTSGPPLLAIGDVDELKGTTAGMVALVSRGWGEPIPLVILSSQVDLEAVAEKLGAVAGLRKPINVGLLTTTVERAEHGA